MVSFRRPKFDPIHLLSELFLNIKVQHSVAWTQLPETCLGRGSDTSELLIQQSTCDSDTCIIHEYHFSCFGTFQIHHRVRSRQIEEISDTYQSNSPMCRPYTYCVWNYQIGSICLENTILDILFQICQSSDARSLYEAQK